MRCLRTPIPRPKPPCSSLSRLIHTSPSSLADTNFTDDAPTSGQNVRIPSRSPVDRERFHRNSVRDQIAYAKQVNERGLRRWQESQEPKGKLQFMTMGREFAIPYNLTQLSYMSLNHMRELRAYYRKIMYEMPQFKQFARPFRPPTKYEVLRFRYTSYLGENHPAAKKVVMEVPLRQLRQSLSNDPRFDDVWEHKFKLLCATRYNPETDMVHMSCEQHPYPAQNKRWLSNKLDEMIQAALTGESYEDIPFDDRHVKKKRIYKIPKDWLRLTPERQAADKAVEEDIFQPALARCVQLAKVESVDAIPRSIQKRLRGIVNGTVRHAVRPGIFADLNDPRVREMVIAESLKHLVWAFQRVETRQADFITPDLSEEEFEKAFKAEQERIAAKEREESLRAEEDKKEHMYNEQQAYAKTNVTDELLEVTPTELSRAREQPSAPETDDFDNSGFDEDMKKALKLREERRKLILSRLDEPDVPEWLKHAVDTEDTEYFPAASGRFSAQKNREEQLAEFFQKELDDVAVGSEEETKILEFMDKFVEDEESGLVEEESVESIKNRVNAMLKEIEDKRKD